MRKNFIYRNEAFCCLHCNTNNPPAKSGCRNHCKECCFSLHVDKFTPGDRENSCHGLMEPIALDKNAKKGYVIIHKCTRCAYKQRNKAAEDDNIDTLISISRKPAFS